MRDNKIIAVTGTPGTGKTTLSEKLSQKLDFELFDLNEFIEKEGIYETDAKGTKIVDPSDLRDSFGNRIQERNCNLVVDGLLSYLLSPDQVNYIVILRTEPDTLEKRLKERDDFSKEKIKENVESEALGTVTSEAIERQGIESVFEINTTEKNPEEVLESLRKGLEDKINLEPGDIDWLEKYVKKQSKEQK